MTELKAPSRGVVLAQRVLVVAWVALGILGALDHTIAERLFGQRFDLLLPHLKYGHVMFNKNPHKATVFEYSRDSGPRRPLAELVVTPAIGYADARLAIDAAIEPMYLAEVCYRATRTSDEHYTFYVDDYDLDEDHDHPAKSTKLTCDSHGLTGG